MSTTDTIFKVLKLVLNMLQSINTQLNQQITVWGTELRQIIIILKDMEERMKKIESYVDDKIASDAMALFDLPK